ncbi:AMP-dependent synthetase/ligase [Tanacetum coccineum]|uniref:AMP-dependent synthetase/ligase n=1 Tax=Tanacetum coccineum TaxID=301880 RepID=A0ABQ5EAA3_9ASTR
MWSISLFLQELNEYGKKKFDSEGKEEAKIGTEISFDLTILKRGKLKDNGGLSKWAFDFVMGKISISDIKNIAKELGVHFTDAEIHAMVEEADRDGVHLGDFSRIIVGFYSINGLKSGKVEVHDNAVVGSQSILLPGSVVENDVILGVLLVAPIDSIIKRGGVYMRSVTPVMI